jgi:catechol 2,3-dioxygenase-like lactoylglutathione lyase family enzyme
MSPPVETVTAEDDSMKELMEKWDSENQVDDAAETDAATSDEDEPLGYDDMLEKFRRNVTVTDNALDHVVLGTSNLEQAIDDFEKLTGVRPLMVVSHNGCGTKSARVAFQQCAFLEFLAPDDKQSSTPLSESLSKIPEGTFVPVHYAVRNSKAEDLTSTWKGLGFEIDNVTMIAKDRGLPWKWSLYFFEGHDDGGLVPFFADWGDAHHAAGRLPIVGELESVVVRGPSDSKLHELLKGVDDIVVETGDDLFEFSFSSPNGKQTFSASSMIGISFPK